jgi:hypothetical protein
MGRKFIPVVRERHVHASSKLRNLLAILSEHYRSLQVMVMDCYKVKCSDAIFLYLWHSTPTHCQGRMGHGPETPKYAILLFNNEKNVLVLTCTLI